MGGGGWLWSGCWVFRPVVWVCEEEREEENERSDSIHKQCLVWREK